MRFTERPDIALPICLEGHIAIIVDTSPSVILVPMTLFHHLQHAEEYRQAPLIGTFVRLIEIFWSGNELILTSFLVFTCHKIISFYLTFLIFMDQKKSGEIPLFIQILIADVGIEFSSSGSHSYTNSFINCDGIIAAIVIGQMAVDVGLFIPEVVLYVAVSAIFTFAIPSYELSISTKIFRVCVLIVTAILGANGFFIRCSFILLFMFVKTYECSLFMASCAILPKSIDASPYPFSYDC